MQIMSQVKITLPNLGVSIEGVVLEILYRGIRYSWSVFEYFLCGEPAGCYDEQKEYFKQVDSLCEPKPYNRVILKPLSQMRKNPSGIMVVNLTNGCEITEIEE